MGCHILVWNSVLFPFSRVSAVAAKGESPPLRLDGATRVTASHELEEEEKSQSLRLPSPGSWCMEGRITCYILAQLHMFLAAPMKNLAILGLRVHIACGTLRRSSRALLGIESYTYARALSDMALDSDIGWLCVNKMASGGKAKIDRRLLDGGSLVPRRRCYRRRRVSLIGPV